MASAFYDVVLQGSIASQETISRFGIWDSSGVSTKAAINVAVVASLLPSFRGTSADQHFYQSVRIRQVYPTPDLAQTFPITPNLPGTAGDDAASTVSTSSLQLVPGPSFDMTGGPITNYIRRGGKHLPAPLNSWFDVAGAWNGTGNAAVATLGAALVDPLDSMAPLEPVILRYTGETPTAYARIAAYVVRGGGSQVTRKVGRGA